MIDHILSLFAGEVKDESLTPSDSRTALAALLVRVARADEDYDRLEIEAILRVLQRRYDLDAVQAEQLRQEAEELEAKAPDTVRFTRTVKDAVPYEERQAVIECLWEVALADGGRDHNEDGLMRLVSNLLGVNDRDSALARQRVAARI